jgi:hypothetical protein
MIWTWNKIHLKVKEWMIWTSNKMSSNLWVQNKIHLSSFPKKLFIIVNFQFLIQLI